MRKIMMLILLCGLTGCCTYQKNYDLEQGKPEKQVKQEYKKCLAGEFIQTLKFWLMLR